MYPFWDFCLFFSANNMSSMPREADKKSAEKFAGNWGLLLSGFIRLRMPEEAM